MDTIEEDRWLTRQEVADRAGVQVKTVASWASQERGPRFTRLGRFARYRLSDVIAWENAQQTRGGGAI